MKRIEKNDRNTKRIDKNVIETNRNGEQVCGREGKYLE